MLPAHKENPNREFDDEQKPHSFIVRVWAEMDGASRRQAYRGYITSLPDGERHYIKSLEEITDFIRLNVDAERTALH